MDINSIFVRLLFISTLCFVINIPLGMWRTKTRKFSLTWFVSIHLAVPFIYLLRVRNGLASWTIAVLVICSVLGQLAGGLLIKKISTNRKSVAIIVIQPYGLEQGGNYLIRFFWLTSGLLSLIIGFIGIFLPLIPTVPLVLFSAIAFAKSSQTLHNWLVNHKYFGSIIKDWQHHDRKMPIRVKIITAVAMMLSLTISMVYLMNR